MRFQTPEGEIEIFPSKIICLLRNYAAHAEELGNTVPERMVYFLKPPSSLLPSGGTVLIPPDVGVVHHEVELAVVIGKKGKSIPRERAMDHVLGFTVMLDITARDVQDEFKRKGWPWTIPKGYDTFAPIGREIVMDYDHHNRRIWLEVNGTLRQDGNTSMMIYDVDEIISEVSRVMTLLPGDIILTGTPPGVGPLQSGDRVRAGVDGITPLEVSVEEWRE